MRAKQIVEQIVECFKKGNKILIIGNGGSSAEASHFSEELISYGYPAIALNDPVVITALANDYGYEKVFGMYLEALGKPGDILVTISTSGESNNIIHATEMAGFLGIDVIEWPRDTGRTTEEIQNYQLKLIHKVYQSIISKLYI
jgi:D-sedoheptulose 7-phosphate isomerase